MTDISHHNSDNNKTLQRINFCDTHYVRCCHQWIEYITNCHPKVWLL